jgi:hypothetical protein
MGQVVTLTAIPDSGEQFLGWTGAAAGTKSSSTLIMNSHKTIGAQFGLPLPVAMGNTNLAWTTGGSVSWFGQAGTSEDGVGAGQSGAISVGQSSWVQTTTNVSQVTYVGFWWSVSSQAPDGLAFVVDGKTNAFISGVGGGWQQFSTYLSPGNHTLTWVYSKTGANDPTGIPFTDSGWVGDVTFGIPPIITNQPVEQIAAQGGSAAFTVGATGQSPLAYQWIQNGSAISGASSSNLFLPDVQAVNAGNYQVVVTNLFGAVTSSVAQLTIVVPGCDAPPSGLVAWWPGDGNAIDVAGANNGQLSNGANYAAGEIGEAFNLTNLDAVVLVGGTTNLQLQNFTIEAWIKRASNASVTEPGNVNSDSDGVVFGFGLNGYALALHANGILFLTKVGVSGLDSSAAVTDTNYHHVAVTTTNGSVVYYLDGVAYPAASYNPVFQFSGSAAIGGPGNLGLATFFGAIDEVSVYSRALSSYEVNAIYLAGAAGKCRPVPIISTVSSESGIPGNVVCIEGTNLAEVVNVKFNGVSAYFVIQQSGQILAIVPPTAKTGPITVETQSSGVSTTANNFVVLTSPGCFSPLSGLIGWWSGNGNAFDVLDTHNGTLQNGATFAPGFAGECFSLNGINQYVDLGSWTPGSAWTIDAWVNPWSVPSGRHVIAGDFGNCHDWGIVLSGNQFAISSRPPGGCWQSTVAAGTVTVGTWYHIAGTCDGTNAQLYVNGILQASAAVDPNYIGDSTDVQIGGDVCCGENFDGLIDEVAIYNHALSSAQVQTIYNAGSAGMCQQPLLSVAVTNAKSVVISWPTTFGNYDLQENSFLASTNWTNVTNPINQVGGQNQVIVMPTAASQFYRLMRQ